MIFGGRFPRVTKIRNDKNWETATSLEELKVLFKNSKENTDVSLLVNQYNAVLNETDEESTTIVDSPKKRKIHDNRDNSSEHKKLKKDSGRTKVKNPLPDLFKGTVALFATSEPTQAERYFNQLILYLVAKNG